VRAAQGGPQSCEQFLHAERLGHVVVRSDVERRDLVRLAIADREHDDGNLREGAEPADDLGPIEVRQSEIEEHDVRPRLGRGDEGLLARPDREDLVPVRLQARAQRATDLRLVVDHQHAGHPDAS
jgi:hypothetical protein